MKIHITMLLCVVLLFTVAGCTRRTQVDRLLEQAESLMTASPASSLSILDSISVSELKTDGQNALYALLKTQARNKLYMFDTNDSLISVATSYFDGKAISEYTFLSHYYKSTIFLNKGEYNSSMFEALTALGIAEKLGTHIILAKEHELLADIYNRSYDVDESIKHRRIAAENYWRDGNVINAAFSIIDLAKSIYRNGDAEGTIAILDSISKAYQGNDSVLLGYVNDTYIAPLTELGRGKEAYEKYQLSKSYWGARAIHIQDIAGIAMMFADLDELDSVDYYLNEQRRVDPNWNDDGKYHMVMYKLARAKKEDELSLKEFELMYSIHDKEMNAALKNNVSYVERDFYQKEAEYKKMQGKRSVYILITLLLILTFVSIGFYIYHRQRMKRRKREIEDKMFEVQTLYAELENREDYINDLKDKLSESNERLSCMNKIMDEADERTFNKQDLLDEFYSTHFKTLDRLSCDYFNQKGTKSLEKTILKDFEAEIDSLKDQKSIAQLKNVIDKRYDGIITRIEAQMPQFKDSDIVFLTFVLAGFSPRAVCLFTDISNGNYYNKWTRLRKRISESDAKDKDFFLLTLSKVVHTSTRIFKSVDE